MIETERLYLKQLPSRAAEQVAEFQTRNRDFMSEQEPPRPENYFSAGYWQVQLRELEVAAREGRQYSFFVFSKALPQDIIGWINFANIVRGAFHACHLGYNLSQGHEGRGFMTEALSAAIGFMFQKHNLHRIMANYVPSNRRSERVLEKLGFEREGLARDYLYLGGAWRDHVLTSLTNPAWVLPSL